MDHLSLVGQKSIANDFVFQVEVQLAVFHQIVEKSGDVSGIHLAGVVSHGRG
jgi:hypothetical protein